MVYHSMHMSNEYLNETQTWGEAINEWLITEEPVVSTSEYVIQKIPCFGKMRLLIVGRKQRII